MNQNELQCINLLLCLKHQSLQSVYLTCKISNRSTKCLNTSINRILLNPKTFLKAELNTPTENVIAVIMITIIPFYLNLNLTSNANSIKPCRTK